MSDVIAPVPVADIDMPKGASRIIRFTITKSAVAVPLTVGCQLIFTARIKNADAQPAIQKSYVAGGVTAHLNPDPGGITANTGIGVGIADMTLAPGDTENVAATLLAYDVWLFDAAGQEVPVLQGTLRLSPSVFRP